MQKQNSKKLFSTIRSNKGRLGATFTVSLSIEQLRALRSRAYELSIPCSILLRILLEVEQRDGIARRELMARLNKGRQHIGTLSQQSEHP